MTAINPNERLLRVLHATPEQQTAIDRVLEGRMEPAPEQPEGTLLSGRPSSEGLRTCLAEEFLRQYQKDLLGIVQELRELRRHRQEKGGR